MNRFEPKMRELHATLLGFESGEQPIRLKEEEIKEAERLIGGRLPEDYRGFVRDFGAFSLHASYPVREGNMNEGAIGYFTGIITEKRRQAFDWVSSYVSRDPQWFPDGAICIGVSGSLPTFLYFTGENKGKIYVRDYDDFWLVADSFTEFMDLLEFEFENDEHEKPYIVEVADTFWRTFSTE